MNYTEHKITLDIQKIVSPVTVSVKKGDTGRRLLIHLAERGYPYHISDGCYAVFTAKKPDGKVIFNDCSIDGCEIRYDVTAQTVAAVGMFDCEIVLYGSGGEQITSALFHMIVEDTIYDTETEVESTSEFNALSALIAEVQALKNSAPSRISEVSLPANRWEGSESPYSQVVQIAGVTENSQVDLTPSVDQLAIFHNKDLAFVTENEDGVVTVYAIGQKPQDDYVIQVTITEVDV